MKYLLDTHMLLWFLTDDARLETTTKQIISDLKNNCAISIVSLWEIAIKKNIGKLQIYQTPYELKAELENLNIEVLPFSIDVIQHYEQLEIIQSHKDPFDRFIISTALTYDYTIITDDNSFKQYTNVNLYFK